MPIPAPAIPAPTYTIKIKSTFCAAHSLACFGPAHPCATLHGHTFKVTVTFAHTGRAVDMDCGELKALVDAVTKTMDHQNLNVFFTLEGDASCEVIAQYIVAALAITNDNPQHKLLSVEVSEGNGITFGLHLAYT